MVTPLIKLDKTLKNLSFNSTVLIKDEGLLPTSSFKARGLAMAVSMAKQLDLSHLAIPTNGNAGAALAAYATKAGMKSTVFCPEGAATFAAFKKSVNSGTISKDESVVLFNCASGLKYPLPEVSKFIDKSKPIDYTLF